MICVESLLLTLTKTDQCRYLNFDALLGDLKRKKLFQLLLSCNLKSLTKVNERQRATDETMSKPQYV